MLIESGVIEDFDFVRQNVNYILVCNSNKYNKVHASESRTIIYGHVQELANEETQMFDIYKFEQYLLKKTNTYTAELFNRKFVDEMEKQENMAS